MAIAPTRSREIQLFDPPPDAVYTTEATSHLVNVGSGAYGARTRNLRRDRAAL